MSALRVSVIIPIYNSNDTIIRCVNSVINQTYPVHEIIIVDDGSKDNSVDLINGLKIARNISNLILIKQKNLGPSVARNAGISIATGEYIAFLDSDDWWLETKIERQLIVFSQNNDIGLVATKYSIEKPEINQIIKYREISFNKLVLKNYFTTSTVMIKKDLLGTILFNSKKKYSEDYELWLKIAYNTTTFISCEKLTVMGKPIISDKGLSSNLWAMEMGELDNIYALRKEKKISFSFWVLAFMYSLIKYIKRLIFVKVKISK